MMKGRFFILLMLLFETILALEQSLDNMFSQENGSTRILSRRKRFLIFPDGSSFQLVFCTQTHGYLQIGDIVWFGNTAALAWELPTDPNFLLKLKKHDKLSYTAQNRNGVSKLLYFLDEKGNVLSKVPYRRRPIVNPAFAKRSVDDHLSETEQVNRTFLHEKQKKLRVFETLDDPAVDFHRGSRMSLYEQFEKFISAIGWQGKGCVLRLLCESGKMNAEQSPFFEEIVKATFSLPAGRESVGDLFQEYDEAHGAKGDCADLYSQCEKID